MAVLGEYRQAYALMKATVAKARTAGMNGQLSDLLEVESSVAEQAGDLRQALADEREVVKLENATTRRHCARSKRSSSSATPRAKRSCASAIWSAPITIKSWS